MKTKKRLFSVLLSCVIVISCFSAFMNITVDADELGNEIVYGIGGDGHQGTFIGDTPADDSDVFELHNITEEKGDTVSDYSGVTVERGKINGRSNTSNTWHTVIPESTDVKRDGTVCENTNGLNYFSLKKSFVEKKTVKEFSVVTMVRSFNKGYSARVGFYSEKGCTFGLYFSGQMDGGIAPYAFVSTPSQLWTEKKSSLYKGAVMYPNENLGHVLIKMRLEYSDNKLSSVSWTVDIYKSPLENFKSDGYTVKNDSPIKYLSSRAVDKQGKELNQISGTITEEMLENIYQKQLSGMKNGISASLNSDNSVPFFMSGGPYSNNHYYQDFIECKYTLDYKKTSENLKTIYSVFSNKKSLDTALYFLNTYAKCTNEIKAECSKELSKIDSFIAENFSSEDISVSQILDTYGSLSGGNLDGVLSDSAVKAVNSAYDRLRPIADGASIKNSTEENISFYALRPQFFSNKKPSKEDMKTVKAFGGVMDYYESVAASGKELTKETAIYNIAKNYSELSKSNVDPDLNFALDSSVNVRFEDQWDTLIAARFYVIYVVNGKEYTVYSNNSIKNPVSPSELTAGVCVRSVNGVMDSIISLLKENYEKHKDYKGVSFKDGEGVKHEEYSAVTFEDATLGNTEYKKASATDTLYFLMSYNRIINAVNGLSAEGDPVVKDDGKDPAVTPPDEKW